MINELGDPKHGPWGFGEIIYTDSYLLKKGEGLPKAICHFCVPRRYSGDSTYLVSLISIFCPSNLKSENQNQLDIG